MLSCEAAPRSAGLGSTRAQIVALSCACAAGSAFLFAVDPHRHAVYPQCLLYRATGLYCAGCGATRALYALLHGRVWEALHDNVVFTILLPVAAVVTGLGVIRAWRENAWPVWNPAPRELLRAGLWMFLTLMLFMVVRNLPGPAFALLKPV